MQVKFQLPELLVLGAVILLTGGSVSYGWVFFGCGLFTAFGRYAMEHQEQSLVKKEVDSLKESIPDFINAFVAAAKSSTKDKIH